MQMVSFKRYSSDLLGLGIQQMKFLKIKAWEAWTLKAGWGWEMLMLLDLSKIPNGKTAT